MMKIIKKKGRCLYGYEEIRRNLYLILLLLFYNFLGVFIVEYYRVLYELGIGWNGKLWGWRSKEEWVGVLVFLYVLSWPRSPCLYTLLFIWMASLLIPLSLTIPRLKMNLISPHLVLSSPYLPWSLLLYLTNILETILIKIIQSFSPNLHNPLIINTKARFHLMKIIPNSHFLCFIHILLFAMI